MLPSPHILVLGNVVADIVARPVDAVPRTGSLHPGSVAFFPGGCAGNSATILARLGVPTQLVACTGADAFGTALREAWEQAGIDLRYTHVLPDTPTGVTIVLVDSRGERRFISTPGANQGLSPSHLPDTALETAFALHVAGFFAAPGLEDGTLAGRLAAARAVGVYTSLDTVGGSARERRAALYPLLPHLDLLLLNEDEAEKVTGQQTRDEQLRFLRERGTETLVLKLGERGALLVTEGQVQRIPPLPARCVDSTGAGDAFAAALLAALARGDTLRDALGWASAAGAATVEAAGATGAWGGWGALEEVRRRG